MSSENNKKQGGGGRQDTHNKKHVKHDPQAESARTKFGKDKPA